MAPATQATLLCTPNDVMDFMSIAGVELRLDDQNLASGQTVLVVTAASAGATSLAVAALRFPLLKGTVLHFLGGGMEEVVEVALTATAVVGATSLTVAALDDDIPAEANAQDSGVNTALARLLPKACNYGTAEVKLYCGPVYDVSQLALDWNINRWASILSAEWVCRRCLRPYPDSMEKYTELVREQLTQVRYGQLYLPDVPTTTANWPFLDNVSVDFRYWTHKNRVQPTISEATLTQFGQYIDWSDALMIGDWGW